MNRFINLKISKSYNYLILNNKSKERNYTKENLSENNQEGIFPYKTILSNLISFLYKKLTPFLFQEVKDYLNLQYIKYQSRNNKINSNSNKSYNDGLINSDNFNINNNNINLSSRQPLKDIKFKIEFTNKRTKTNYQINKKIYIPKSEQKKTHSGKNKYKIINQNNYKMNKNTTFNKRKSKSKETKKSNNNNLSQKCFFIDDNGGNEITSIKTFINNQVRRNKTNSKNKNIFQYKNKKENSRDSSKNNSISDSRSIFINSNQKNKDGKKNKKIISNILYTTRQINDDKNKNKINSSSKKKKHLTKSQPSVNEKLLYHLSFNNNYNQNINNENGNNDFHYIKNNEITCSLKKNNIKKNNLQVYQGNIEQKDNNKSKASNKTTIMQKSLMNFIRAKKNSNKSKSYSTLKNKNIIHSQRNKNAINGIGKNELYNLNSNEKSIYSGNNNNNNIDQNKNLANKKYKLLNEEMMKKIKSTIDDNLKIMFNFSYENFLSKESEQESNELSIERQRYMEERNYSGERI